MAREVISPEGLRQDGRRPNEVRRLTCELGLLSRADGSALLELGRTKVLAAVHGPMEAKFRADSLHDRADVNVEVTQTPFSTSERRVHSRQDRQLAEFAALLRRTLEAVVLTAQFPRSQINVYVEILQSDGGALAAAVNAASLALINAGVPMRGFLACCSAGFAESTPLVDLNYVEKTGGTPELVAAVLPATEEVVLLQLERKLPLENLAPVMELAVAGCQQVYRVLREQVKTHSLALKANALAE